MADNYSKISKDLTALQKAFDARVKDVEDKEINQLLTSISEALEFALSALNEKEVLQPSSYDKKLLESKIRALEVYQSYKASLSDVSAVYEYDPNGHNFVISFDYKTGKWVFNSCGLLHTPTHIYFKTPDDAEKICSVLEKLLPQGPRLIT